MLSCACVAAAAIAIAVEQLQHVLILQNDCYRVRCVHVVCVRPNCQQNAMHAGMCECVANSKQVGRTPADAACPLSCRCTRAPAATPAAPPATATRSRSFTRTHIPAASKSWAAAWSAGMPHLAFPPTSGHNLHQTGLQMSLPAHSPMSPSCRDGRSAGDVTANTAI